MSPVVAVIAPGAMGAAVAARIGVAVLTNLEGRSQGTKDRAAAAGMQNASYADIAARADWVLSILPPRDALALAKTVRATWSPERSKRLVYVDANAVNPDTAKAVAEVWRGADGVKFLDAGIIGGPPSAPGADAHYDPTMYASAGSADVDVLREFVALGKEWDVKIVALEGEGAGIGDASALKMSYAGIAKGLTGLVTTMILSAHASSPATAQALLYELSHSQPQLLQRMTRSIPDMLPKAYRFSGEMEEISAFVTAGLDAGPGQIHAGLARLYERVEASLQREGEGEVNVLNKFVEDAKGELTK